MNLYRRVIGYYRPYLGTICFSLILLVIGVGFGLLKYVPVQWVIDHVVKAGANGTVHWQGLTLSPGKAALFGATHLVSGKRATRDLRKVYGPTALLRFRFHQVNLCRFPWFPSGSFRLPGPVSLKRIADMAEEPRLPFPIQRYVDVFKQNSCTKSAFWELFKHFRYQFVNAVRVSNPGTLSWASSACPDPFRA